MHYNLIMNVMVFIVFVMVGSTSFACFESGKLISKNSFGKYLDTKAFQFSPAFNNFCIDAKLKGNFDKLPASDLVVSKPISKFNLVIEDQEEIFKKNFKAEVERVKTLPLEVRFKSIYEFVTSQFGFMTYQGKKYAGYPEFEILKTANLVKNALLAHMLMEARKNNSEYKVNILISYPESIEKSRQWVRVEVSESDKVQKLDLDPSLTGREYLPLVNRHTGLDATVALMVQEECEIVTKCLISNLQRTVGK